MLLQDNFMDFKSIKKENDAKLELFILADVNTDNNNKYINFSVNNNGAGDAPDAKLELHLPHKRGLSGHPGSIPGWGALPTFNIPKSNSLEK